MLNKSREDCNYDRWKIVVICFQNVIANSENQMYLYEAYKKTCLG